MTARQTLDQAMDALPLTYPGPGGAAAVLRDGKVLARTTWGYADVERRIPFTPQTLFRICSISKQFTCGLMLDRFPDPSVLDADVAARMPLLTTPPPALRLAHNQSGLRDYWATAMLCGSPIEAPFAEHDARRLIAMTSSLHFTPGTRYSYCNQNFRILSDIVAVRLATPYADLLRRYVFDPAGMPTAQLCADTSQMPDGTVGYEGDVEVGFRPAVNRIDWTGDAGIGASLDDLIAWEQVFDAQRDDPASLTQRLATPQTFTDGTPAPYGFGLSKVKLLGHEGTGHGGGLRGWRSFRFYLPGPRISVVVLFNHMADTRAAALDLLATLVDAPTKPTPPTDLGPSWNGAWQEPETGLVVRVESTPDHKIALHYSGLHPDTLNPISATEARTGGITLHRTEAGLRMERITDNHASDLTPITGTATPDVTGRFHSQEYNATFEVIATGPALYAAFTGFLGQGTMNLLIPVGPDLWRLPMPRALDHSPPGDWTIQFERDETGKVTKTQIGCWLARRVVFERV